MGDVVPLEPIREEAEALRLADTVLRGAVREDDGVFSIQVAEVSPLLDALKLNNEDDEGEWESDLEPRMVLLSEKLVDCVLRALRDGRVLLDGFAEGAFAGDLDVKEDEENSVEAVSLALTDAKIGVGERVSKPGEKELPPDPLENAEALHEDEMVRFRDPLSKETVEVRVGAGSREPVC